MEFLDVYNENHEMIGTFSRDEVHTQGMWHNTVHCWLYDKEGNIYFQVRSDANKLYTTTSGHVQAGETLKEAFGREVKEEIGIEVDYDDAELIDVVSWKRVKNKNGKLIQDRAFANVHILLIDSEACKFHFNDAEVIAIAKVNASETLKLFKGEISELKGIFIDSENKKEKIFTKEDFLLVPGETLIGKYGKILEEVMKRK